MYYRRHSQLPRSFQYANGSKNVPRLKMQRQLSVPNGKKGNQPSSFVCSDDAELGHFTFLPCRRRQRNVQRFIMHVESYCFAYYTFSLVRFLLQYCLLEQREGLFLFIQQLQCKLYLCWIYSLKLLHGILLYLMDVS